MYLRGVICATSIYKVFTRHLNVECFESVVPAIFLSYAPTFFEMCGFYPGLESFMLDECRTFYISQTVEVFSGFIGWGKIHVLREH